jgi:hypothetical protein
VCCNEGGIGFGAGSEHHLLGWTGSALRPIRTLCQHILDVVRIGRVLRSRLADTLLNEQGTDRVILNYVIGQHGLGDCRGAAGNYDSISLNRQREGGYSITPHTAHIDCIGSYRSCRCGRDNTGVYIDGYCPCGASTRNF